MSVRIKYYMHSNAWLGLTATVEARIDVEPHKLFSFDAPTFKKMPPFELKTIDITTVIALIEKRSLPFDKAPSLGCVYVRAR